MNRTCHENLRGTGHWLIGLSEREILIELRVAMKSVLQEMARCVAKLPDPYSTLEPELYRELLAEER